MRSTTTESSERTSNETKPEARKILDIPAIVAYLTTLGGTDVSVSSVRALLSTGAIPRIKIGKRFYASREAVDEWLARSQRRAGR